MYRDKNMDWARQRHVIEGPNLTAFAGEAVSLTSDTATIAEINSLGFSAVSFAADGDSLAHTMKVPAFFDVDRPIGVTLEWSTGSSTDADDVRWTVLADAIAPGETLAAPATALNTDIASQTVGTAAAYVLRETPRGIINAGRIERGDRLVISIARHSETDAASLFLHALILDYMPKLAMGPGTRFDRDYQAEQNNQKY